MPKWKSPEKAAPPKKRVATASHLTEGTETDLVQSAAEAESLGLPSKTKVEFPVLRVYVMGPGIGESLVIHLPCGAWGVVDCYQTGKGGTLDFLRKMKVQRLKFFCLTHPHEDHYRGCDKLFDHFHGKIDHLWLFPGITSKDFINLAAAARIRYKYVGESRAEETANEYLRVLKRLIRERELLDNERYRRVISSPQSAPLLKDPRYCIRALGPGSLTVDHFLEHFAPIAIRNGPMLLSEEGGEFINSISIVLEISFDQARIFLLGDAQGRNVALDSQNPQGFTLVKLAHHGSDNGLGAQVLTVFGRRCFKYGLVTPYLRSGLPRDNMLKSYEKACVRLVHTTFKNGLRPQHSIVSAANAQIANPEVIWTGLEISGAGTVRRLPEKATTKVI